VGRTVSSAADRTGPSPWLEADPHPSGHELIEVEEVLDEALEGLGTASTRGNGAGSGVGVEAALIEEVEPADDRVQWLAQFVRHGVEELVFEATGRLRLGASVPLDGETEMCRDDAGDQEGKKARDSVEVEDGPEGPEQGKLASHGGQHAGEDPEPESSVPSATTIAMVRSK
jgi:hypothetical protein